MKNIFITIIMVLTAGMLSAADLSIGPSDVRIIQSPEGGYHLYIRKKKDINSVLITESTKDPQMLSANYAYRTRDYNPVNGDELRMLDGEFIPKEDKIYSLIDSTPEQNTPLGEAFHIWIPYIILYGYENTRHGEVQVLDGTFLNIRAFEKPYADYTGQFKDNPFQLRVTQKSVAEHMPDTAIYMKDTVTAFSNLADVSQGKITYAKGADDILPQITKILTPAGDKSLDLVFVIDATESMQDDIKILRELLASSLNELLPQYPSWRVGLVLYKDYFDDFLVKSACPFTPDLNVFMKALGSFRPFGGRDIPEAVYEGIDAGLAYPWNPASDKKIILIGDAPPHPKPRGRITKETVENNARSKNVQINVIILPHGNTY
ncbi:VWA domain-containing protein [Brucepastera parasyntrophica]|uniref:vWA domain-containing protein n=1 Tax=Brucepastera parasyntrophica TaxID=2880008 RepID=UPI00210EF8F9|nr:vWA domain-containing protein [Brucepastera parasyntrophica]ULQ60379.1 VWA domain-containing protein [Brucepastera parasyntrophica]